MVRGEHASPTVNFLFQPSSEWHELPCCDVFFQLRQFLLGLFEELHRIEVAQGIGGKVAECAHRPMYVLQDTLGILLWNDSQVGLHFFVPELR